MQRPKATPKRKLACGTAAAALPLFSLLLASPSGLGERRVTRPKAFAHPVLTTRQTMTHPCVFASVHGSAVFTSFGDCSAPTGRPEPGLPAISNSDPDAAVIDHFEVDLQHGTFVTRQTDLMPTHNGAVPLTRFYVSQSDSPAAPACSFGRNTVDSLHLAPASSKRVRPNPGINLAHLQSPRIGWLHLAYDGQLRIREARDSHANAVRYVYNQDGMLSYAFNSSGIVRHYLYDHAQMIAIEDETGNTLVHNVYQAGRIISQQYANGDTYRFTYAFAPNSQEPESVTVTLPDHTERVVPFGASISLRF